MAIVVGVEVGVEIGVEVGVEVGVAVIVTAVLVGAGESIGVGESMSVGEAVGVGIGWNCTSANTSSITASASPVLESVIRILFAPTGIGCSAPYWLQVAG